MIVEEPKYKLFCTLEVNQYVVDKCFVAEKVQITIRTVALLFANLSTDYLLSSRSSEPGIIETKFRLAAVLRPIASSETSGRSLDAAAPLCGPPTVISNRLWNPFFADVSPAWDWLECAEWPALFGLCNVKLTERILPGLMACTDRWICCCG